MKAYIILTGTNPEQLEKQVNRARLDGAELVGGISVAFMPDTQETLFVQAIIATV